MGRGWVRELLFAGGNGAGKNTHGKERFVWEQNLKRGPWRGSSLAARGCCWRARVLTDLPMPVWQPCDHPLVPRRCLGRGGVRHCLPYDFLMLYWVYVFSFSLFSIQNFPFYLHSSCIKHEEWSSSKKHTIQTNHPDYFLSEITIKNQSVNIHRVDNIEI